MICNLPAASCEYGCVRQTEQTASMSLTIACSAAGKSVATTVAKKFGGAVIERWTRYRAERFFEGFVDAVGLELATGAQTEELDRRLAEILSDDTRSEVLFDAYRRVCFSKSKTLGPRIIGLLSGRLVHEGRMASRTEEEVFAAAETLSDADFIEFMKGYEKHRKKAEGVLDRKAEHSMLGESVIVRWLDERFDDCELGPFPWEDALGRWAASLSHLGLLEVRLQQRVNPSQRSAVHEDWSEMDGQVTTTIIFSPGCARLYELLSRSLGPESSPV
jgi:hypothetical protein